jgi:hypothetical protein
VSSPLAARLAGVALILEAGFGLTMPVALLQLRRTGELPMTPFGFRAFAGGPFDRLPVEGFAVAGAVLMAVCAFDVVAGIRLWRGDRRGANLGLATSPAVLAVAVGFALPLLLIQLPIRIALLIAARPRVG